MEVNDIKIIGTRGNTQGQIYTPHRQNDGTYVVSKTRFAKDNVFVHTADEIIEHVKQGFSVRMSTGTVAPSLICAKRVMAENPALFA